MGFLLLFGVLCEPDMIRKCILLKIKRLWKVHSLQEIKKGLWLSGCHSPYHNDFMKYYMDIKRLMDHLS